jgi:hypothetical protein
MDDLEITAALAELRHHAALSGFTVSDARPPAAGGFRLVLVPEEGPEDEYLATMERGAKCISLALLAVVDEAFLLGNLEAILGVAARFEVCLSLEDSAGLASGERYVQLSLRVFTPGLNTDVVRLAAENLAAARDALEAAFP